MEGNSSGADVAQDFGRLVVVEQSPEVDVDLVIRSLRQDLVVLIRGVSAVQADSIIYNVADKLGLRATLELQSGFAGFKGHRHNIGKYFMSVNKRQDYQFVTPHSEGDSFIGMQLASFFCYENSTNGGETILMNVDDSSQMWKSLRERIMRGRLGSRQLARHEILRARGLYSINLPADVLRDDDQILQEHPTEIPGLTVVEVLSKPVKTYSGILNRRLNVYWDSIESNDFDSAREYARLLRLWGLLKEPSGGLGLHLLDSSAERRIHHSGVGYGKLFKCRITLRLAPGDLLIQNNLTWTHGATNWSPSSGVRKIAASFA